MQATRTILIALIIASLGLANLGHAGEEWQNNPQPAHMSDAKMKALLIGTWHAGDQAYTFTADGKWIYNDNSTEKWDVKDGQLIQIRTPAADRPYTIVFLTKHECLIFAGHHEQGYAFWWR